MTEIIIIPGFMQTSFSPKTRRLLRTFRQAGMPARVINIPWAGHTLSEWLQAADNNLQNTYLPDTVVVGWSYGAMIATMLASRQTPHHLVLGALPGNWVEETIVLRSRWCSRRIEERRRQDFQTYHFESMARLITSPTTILISDQDIAAKSELYRQARIAHRSIRGSRLRVVSQVGQFTKHPNFYQDVQGLVSRVI